MTADQQTAESDVSITEDDFWEGLRSALLTIVDLIERRRCISPRTAEIRQQWRRDKSNTHA